MKSIFKAIVINEHEMWDAEQSDIGITKLIDQKIGFIPKQE